MTTRWRWVAVGVTAVLWGWSAATWAPPGSPQGWVGVDTRFRGEAGRYAGYAQQLETIRLVNAAIADGKKVVVLPESAAGFWTPTVERLWRRALAGTGATVIAGAAIVDRAGYDNVMMEVSRGGAEVLYQERMPVPVSMWQPWLRWIGYSGGTRAHFFGNPIANVNGVKVAPLICYEQLIIWPVLQSMLHRPDVIVAIGNDWWTEGTSILEIQKAGTEAWALLFGLPLIKAFNH